MRLVGFWRPNVLGWNVPKTMNSCFWVNVTGVSLVACHDPSHAVGVEVATHSVLLVGHSGRVRDASRLSCVHLVKDVGASEVQRVFCRVMHLSVADLILGLLRMVLELVLIWSEFLLRPGEPLP